MVKSPVSSSTQSIDLLGDRSFRIRSHRGFGYEPTQTWVRTDSNFATNQLKLGYEPTQNWVRTDSNLERTDSNLGTNRLHLGTKRPDTTCGT